MTVQLPFEHDHPLDVPPQLRQLRRDGVIHRVKTAAGHEAWLVTGYEEVRSLLADDRLGRSHKDPEQAARIGQSALFGGPLGNYDTEQEDSTRLRSLLLPHFSPRRMREFRPRVEELASGLLDQLAEHGSPADLHQELALPLPILVICELLGVPYADRDRFRAWSESAGDTSDRARSEHGLGELFGYGSKLVANKRRRPGDDIISRLCATPGLADDEIAVLAMSLLFAGHETTVVAIGIGALCLLANPGQQRALAEQPDLVSRAAEEMLRMPSRKGIPRYARTDFQIAGVTVRAGELVLLDNSSANHDDVVFADPDRFDVSRRGPTHLSFGHGGHYCIGAPLARIELQAVFSRLLARFPTMRLAVPVSQLRLRKDALTGGLVALPVRW
jgi:pentalenolactone synthase